MQSKSINIFLAAASDSNDLVQIVNEEVEHINRMLLARRNLSIKIDYWQNVPAAMGNAESRILAELDLSQYDLFLEIFRFYYGKPTGNINPDTCAPYKSGMEEEFYSAYRKWKERGTPEIVILKSEEPIPRAIIGSHENFAALDAFFAEFSGTGKHPGLYNTFSSTSQFRDVVRRNIVMRIFDYISDHQNICDRDGFFPSIYDNGFTDFFCSGENERRNAAKIAEISTSRKVSLFARSGVSFVGYLGPFYPHIVKALDAGMLFHILIQNPFSMPAIYGTLIPQEKRFSQIFLSYTKGRISAQELFSSYLETHWINDRFTPSINHYRILKKKYPKQVELRLSDMDCSTTLLLTDKSVFFKPAINAADDGRRKPPLFEIEASCDSDLYKFSNMEFSKQWSLGISLKYFEKKQAILQQQLINTLANRQGT